MADRTRPLSKITAMETNKPPLDGSMSLALRIAAAERKLELYNLGICKLTTPLIDDDLAAPFGFHLHNARLAYPLIPFDRSTIGRFYDAPPKLSYASIAQIWGEDHPHATIAFRPGTCGIVVLQVSRMGLRGFARLVQFEELFGRVPLTRVVQADNSYDIHMLGRSANRHDCFGMDLTLMCGDAAVILPCPRNNRRWIAMEPLQPAPAWVTET